MKHVSYLFLVMFLLSLASCDKAIPDETMDGRGTFYCKVNGEDYFPDCQGFACQDVGANYLIFQDVVAFGSKNDELGLDINIYVYNVQSNPAIVNEYSQEPYLENTFIFQGCGNTFLEDESDFNIVISKVDLESRIISG